MHVAIVAKMRCYAFHNRLNSLFPWRKSWFYLVEIECSFRSSGILEALILLKPCSKTQPHFATPIEFFALKIEITLMHFYDFIEDIWCALITHFLKTVFSSFGQTKEIFIINLWWGLWKQTTEVNDESDGCHVDMTYMRI